jgi:drug/metabolite transporter (DMT)-like permease
MILGLVVNSIFFVFTLSEYLICMKYINYEYNYKNAWFNLLLSTILTPIYFVLLYKKENRENVKDYFRQDNRIKLLFPFITGILYTIETILLFYALNTITLSYYTLLRSGFILFNIPYFKYLLQKKITNIYLFSCLLLLVSHSIIIANYLYTATNKIDTTTNTIDTEDKTEVGEIISNTVIIYITCCINATYNNLIEYSVKKYNISNIDYQIFFQIVYFFIIIIPSIYYTISEPPPINSLTLFLYFLIAFGLQLYMYNKIYILHNKNDIVPANILMSSLDLLRRIIQLLFSFLFFNEHFDIYVILSLVFLGFSSLLLLYQYFLNNNKNEKHQKLVDII